MDKLKKADKENIAPADAGLSLPIRFFLLLLVGFILILAGIAVVLFATMLTESGSVNGSAVIFIGPFPIVIGAGPDVALIILFIINSRCSKHGGVYYKERNIPGSEINFTGLFALLPCRNMSIGISGLELQTLKS